MENTVDTTERGIVLDDAVQAPEDNQGEPLSTLLEQKPETEPTPAKEPGWIKQRVNAAVTKAEARIRAEYEARLAPLYESMMDREAQELHQSGEFKTLERAKEYVLLKNGITPQPEQQQRPSSTRDAQSAPEQQTDPVAHARAELLAQQAQKIKQGTGLDVMREFADNPEIKQRVISGEWDFHDVADYMSAQSDTPSRVPAPMRSPNGAKVEAVSISAMSPAQFAQLQENLANGRIYDMRK